MSTILIEHPDIGVEPPPQLDELRALGLVEAGQQHAFAFQTGCDLMESGKSGKVVLDWR